MTTIGELVKAQMFKARAAAFGFWLLIVLGVFLPLTDTYPALLIVPFVGFMGSVLYILFLVKCPKCDAKLGQVMSGVTKPKFCPGCGSAFDSRV